MSVHSVNLSDAEGHLADLIKLLDSGDEVVIVRANGPEIRLVVQSEKKRERIFGLHEGDFYMSEDFNDSMPEGFLMGDD